MTRGTFSRQRGRPRARRGALSLAVLTLTSGLLAACSGDSDGKTELTWYINPDIGGQAAVAENCSTDEYTIDHPGAPPGARASSASSCRDVSRPRIPRST